MVLLVLASSVFESLSDSPVLLTLDDVRRLKDERDEVARDHDALGKRLDELNQKIAAVAFFLPAHLQNRILEKAEAPTRGKWGPVIHRILEDAGRGLTTGEIRERLKGTDLENEVGYHGNALYNGLSKLVGKGAVIKDNGYYRLPGQISGAPEVVNSASQLEKDIVEALKSTVIGLKSIEIAGVILKENYASAAGMQKSLGGFYKKLSIMAASGEVVKDGRLYRLPPAKEGDGGTEAAGNGSAESGDERPRTLRIV